MHFWAAVNHEKKDLSDFWIINDGHFHLGGAIFTFFIVSLGLIVLGENILIFFFKFMFSFVSSVEIRKKCYFPVKQNLNLYV